MSCIKCMFVLDREHNIIVPVYSRQLQVYPFLLSARTKAFIPHLVGFLGRYCMKESLPLNPIMDSSIDSSCEGW